MLEPDFLFDDERFVWGKRRTVRGGEKSSRFDERKGSRECFRDGSRAQETGKIRRRTDAWSAVGGDKSWDCQRCRFCGKNHIHSQDRRCCNCGWAHNAGFLACKMGPAMPTSQLGSQVTKRGQTNMGNGGATMNNVWQDDPGRIGTVFARKLASRRQAAVSLAI